MEADPWLLLRNAIIEQAAQDFVTGFSDPERFVETHNVYHGSYKVLKQEAVQFLTGKWCEALLSMDDSDITGPAILRRLKEYTLQDLKARKNTKKGKRKRMKVTLIQQTPNPVETIAKIASICYDSTTTNKAALVKHLYLNGHHSPFEHIYFTFKVEGISRACSHQLVRHRLVAFTQRSQRYCEENGFDYVTPALHDPAAQQRYQDTISHINDAYCDLVHVHEVKKEDARFLLPNACTTSLYMSCNLRELIHICNERMCTRAQWEIRELAHKMAALVDPGLQWMLVPKCESGFAICNMPCHGRGYKLLNADRKEGDAQ